MPSSSSSRLLALALAAAAALPVAGLALTARALAPGEVATEVTRSGTIVSIVDGDETQFQGSVTKIAPPRAVTTYGGAADDATFRFPHTLGHLRAIDVATLTSTATSLASASVLHDVAALLASNQPPALAAGCGVAPYTASCRNLFTTTTTGALPAAVPFTIAEAATLQPLLGAGLTVVEAETLIGRVVKGADEDGDGVLEAALGGVDRSTVAVVEASPLVGEVRPTMIYVGALDGMLHAICGEPIAPCAFKGQELWAFIPRTQLPLLGQNTQRIDGTPRVAEVLGDPDPAAPVEDRFRTVLTFQTGSGDPANPDAAPAIVALEITDPASPRVLWERATPATRSDFEIGVGLGLAMGPVRVSGTTKHLTFAQTANGGTIGAGFVVAAYDSLTGVEQWSFEHAYPAPRDGGNPAVPASGIPGGVAAYSATGGNAITNLVVPSLYGDLWQLDAGTGANVHGADPLLRFTTDFHPIGATPTIFRSPQTGKLSVIAVSGGYADPVAATWSPDGVDQYAVAMSLDPADRPVAGFDETSALLANLGTSRAFAQAVVAGNEIFIATDTGDANDAGYGLTSATGALRRISLVTGAQVGSTTTLAGGASSVRASKSGVVVSGGGASVQKDDFGGDFESGGAAAELGFREAGERLFWISE